MKVWIFPEKCNFYQFYKVLFLIKQFISTLNIKLISIILHYSYKNNNEVIAKGHFKQQNSTCVLILALFSICLEKLRYHWRKTPPTFSWVNSVVVNTYLFRTDKKPVYIESVMCNYMPIHYSFHICYFTNLLH